MLKKVLVLIVSMGLLLTAFPNEYAATEESPTVTVVNDEEIREILMAKAIEAFPEYEEKIRGENEINLGKARSGGMGEVVYSETRRLSETEVVAYTEYDTGIAATALAMATGQEQTHAFHRGEYMYYEMNVWLMYGNSQDCLFVEDFGYGIYSNAYDKIILDGNIDSILCTTKSTMIESKVTSESADGPAKIVYGGNFEFYVHINGGEVPYLLYGRLIIEVGNDTYTLSCDN